MQLISCGTLLTAIGLPICFRPFDTARDLDVLLLANYSSILIFIVSGTKRHETV